MGVGTSSVRRRRRGGSADAEGMTIVHPRACANCTGNSNRGPRSDVFEPHGQTHIAPFGGRGLYDLTVEGNASGVWHRSRGRGTRRGPGEQHCVERRAPHRTRRAVCTMCAPSPLASTRLRMPPRAAGMWGAARGLELTNLGSWPPAGPARRVATLGGAGMVHAATPRAVSSSTTALPTPAAPLRPTLSSRARRWQRCAPWPPAWGSRAN